MTTETLPRRRSRTESLLELMLRADAAGFRLEIVEDLPVWELSPLYGHQTYIDDLRASITPQLDRADKPCECHHISDVYFQFPDGSLKRPDISILCERPKRRFALVTIIPEAVVEVLSEGFEKKDTEVGVPFYLAQGVKDVIVVDPRNGKVGHHRRDGERKLQAPITIDLECGCRITVPAVEPDEPGSESA